MKRILSIPVKQVQDPHVNTLSFIDNDDPGIKTTTETVREKKIEKSVHFASEDEHVSSSERSATDSSHTGRELLSWIPSENLYSEDTFIPESSTGVTGGATNDTTGTPSTANTYGSSTFIELESEDETKTESDFSYTESIGSSEIFSPNSGSATYREWKDVTEIVKDIEDLEESEFVTQASVDYLGESYEDYTDLSDSLNEELGEQAKQEFLLASIRKLRLGSVYSPRSLAGDYSPLAHKEKTSMSGKNTKERLTFCQKMIQRCKSSAVEKSVSERDRATDLHKKAESAKHQVLEHYGVSSSLVDRLKFDNLCQRLDKRAKELDQEAEESKQFVKDHADVETDIARQTFISKMQASVQRENSEERIQAHLIRMHPVKWFSEFVNDLPRYDEDSREILYKYKCLVQKRKEAT